MPLYEYKCDKCGNVAEFLLHGAQASAGLTCPACGSMEMSRLLSVPVMIKNETRAGGTTCCGREERCDTPPCSSGGGGCCRG